MPGTIPRSAHGDEYGGTIGAGGDTDGEVDAASGGDTAGEADPEGGRVTVTDTLTGALPSLIVAAGCGAGASEGTTKPPAAGGEGGSCAVASELQARKEIPAARLEVCFICRVRVGRIKIFIVEGFMATLRSAIGITLLGLKSARLGGPGFPGTRRPSSAAWRQQGRHAQYMAAMTIAAADPNAMAGTDQVRYRNSASWKY